MDVHDVNLMDELRKVFPKDKYIFNPSIGHIKDDIYIISVRTYVNDPKKPIDYEDTNLYSNPQHPWATKWIGEDRTYIFPIQINKKGCAPLINNSWPVQLPVQDMRIFKFTEEDEYISYILTFNQHYSGEDNLIIKGGDYCDKNCYLINWSYLIVNKNTFNFYYTPSNQPLCLNISNPVEKNWSLWTLIENNLTYLISSYSLTPAHLAFSFKINGVKHHKIQADSDCKMYTATSSRLTPNILGQLERYYTGLHVSLSTPSYQITHNYYQAVGHIKIRNSELLQMAKNPKDKRPLATFSKKYLLGHTKGSLNPNYIYFMFIYRFFVDDKIYQHLAPDYSADPTKEEKIAPSIPGSGLWLTHTHKRKNASIVEVSPAFVGNVDDYNTLLNFPSGQVLTKNETIISYGNSDATSHVMFIQNADINEYMQSVDKVLPSTYQFVYANKDKKDNLHFPHKTTDPCPSIKTIDFTKHYKLGKFLSRGEYGLVYKVTRLADMKTYALKIPFTKPGKGHNYVNSEEYINNFSALEAISYDNNCNKLIVCYKDIFLMKNVPKAILNKNKNATLGIVMEYIDGYSLKDYKPKNKDIPKLISQLFEILSILHDYYLSPRDLHGYNILIRKNGTPVLIDVDLLCNTLVDNKECTTTDEPRSTNSPEELLGAKSINYIQADVWTLGMLILQDVFKIKLLTPTQLIKKLAVCLKKDLSVMSFLPKNNVKTVKNKGGEKVYKVLDKALQCKPSHRLTAREIVAELKL